MSKQLEQILDLLLNENSEQAEAMFHDYMVSKARNEYQRQLDEEEEKDEDDEDEHMEEIDFEQTNESEEDEDESESEDEGDLEAELDSEDEGEEDEDSEEDVEDRVDSLEDDLAELQAEFERLMAGDEGEGEEFGDDMADGDMIDQGGDFEDDVVAGDEMEMDMDDPALREATKFQDKTSDQPMTGKPLKGSEADKEESPFTKTPGKPGVKPGDPIHIKSKDGDSAVKHEKPKSSRYDGRTNEMSKSDAEKKSGKQPMKKGGGSED